MSPYLPREVRLALAALVLTFFALILLGNLFGCSTTQPAPSSTNPCGVVNFAQVDANVYRSGQPTTVAQWQCLAKLGVTDILKLNRDSEGGDFGAVGMVVHAVPVPPFTDDTPLGFDNGPSQEQLEAVARTLRVMPAEGKWLIHCVHGQDRTGLAVGMYRVLVNGWTKDRAKAEMDVRGFHDLLLGLAKAWRNWDPEVAMHAWFQSANGGLR